jgi:hypothetical protein
MELTKRVKPSLENQRAPHEGEGEGGGALGNGLVEHAGQAHRGRVVLDLKSRRIITGLSILLIVIWNI